MKKHIPDEKMDEILKQLENGLGDILDGVADVKCIKGNSIDKRMIETYMNYPILEIKVSREGVSTNVSKCSTDDIIECLPHTIGTLLGLVPASKRNKILYEAIQQDMSEQGSLLDEVDRRHSENEDEDDE